MVACVHSGYLYSSSDYGQNWTALTSLGTNTWNWVACSSDFSTVAAVASDTHVYLFN